MGLDHCHAVMEKERQTTPAVCKVFVPAIVSKRLPTMRGPHAVIIPVSQGHDIVTVTLNDDEFFFLLSFNLYLVEFQQGGTGLFFLRVEWILGSVFLVLVSS